MEFVTGEEFAIPGCAEAWFFGGVDEALFVDWVGRFEARLEAVGVPEAGVVHVLEVAAVGGSALHVEADEHADAAFAVMGAEGEAEGFGHGGESIEAVTEERLFEPEEAHLFESERGAFGALDMPDGWWIGFALARLVGVDHDVHSAADGIDDFARRGNRVRRI